MGISFIFALKSGYTSPFPPFNQLFYLIFLLSWSKIAGHGQIQSWEKVGDCLDEACQPEVSEELIQVQQNPI